MTMLSMMGMGLSQIGRGSAQRRRRMRAERRDYLRYPVQLRGQARQAAADRQLAAHWDHPNPRDL